jgi:hypothetical protein
VSDPCIKRATERQQEVADEAAAGLLELTGRGLHRFDVGTPGVIDIYDLGKRVATIKLGPGRASITLAEDAAAEDFVAGDPPCSGCLCENRAAPAEGCDCGRCGPPQVYPSVRTIEVCHRWRRFREDHWRDLRPTAAVSGG